MIHVIAVITAMHRRRRRRCRERAEVPDEMGPETFLVIEKWQSMEALQAHAAAPHMAAYGASTKELVASRVIHILSPAS